ncbi:hypothetical protein [Sulfuricaulis sp.]|jgi:hypothetical protein|uniref:hypothetical protein n=1 Tax=Sulfuricaulis sp. TaxID=2003553 RepID=UPI00355A7447
MNKPTLIFVYNSDSGFVNTLLDIGHKIVSPQTYACNLCAITHSTFGMRDEWKRFVDGIKIPVEFLHRDELSRQYGIHGAALPAVFRKTDGGLEVWISHEEINRCRSLDELKRLVGQKRQV